MEDRQSGKRLWVTLWESERAMRASKEEADHRLSQQSAEAASQTVGDAERYEVAFFEVET